VDRPLEAESTDPDRAVVRSLLAGDAAALRALVDRLYGPMTRLAVAILGDARHADDVVQDTWVAVLASLASFEGRSSLKTWVLRILSNHARTLAVRLGRSEQLGWMEAEPTDDDPAVDRARFSAIGRWREAPAPWAWGDPEGALLRREIREVLARAMEELAPGQRAVVSLRDVEGLSSEEACEVLRITEANQRVLLHRGRSRLRRAIEKELGAKP
jgi:RNA polymerase sigma-70 factor (ECF subfamily)